MEEEGLYTNLLNDNEDSSAFALPSFNSNPAMQQSQESLTVNLNIDSTRPNTNNRRSKNFSEDEDKLLVASWLNVGIDPVHGTNQSRGAFWKRIFDFFHKNKNFPSDRSQNSLVHRWSTIQECVNKFCGCLAQIERRRQSGVTLQDQLMEACALYKATDKDNKSFQFMHCWNLLRAQQKWVDKMSELSSQKNPNKKQKTKADSSLGMDSVVNGNTVNLEVLENSSPDSDVGKNRPIGNKKAKEGLRRDRGLAYKEALDHLWEKKKEADAEKELKKEERYKQALELEKESIELEKEKLQVEQLRLANEQVRAQNEQVRLGNEASELHLKRMLEEERIMTMNTSVMNEEQQQYYNSLRSEIMARRGMSSA